MEISGEILCFDIKAKGFTLLSGLVVVGLNIASAQNGSITAATITNDTVTSTVLPASTVNPATGYGHFNVSNCILLDISCFVSMDLLVGNEVSM